MNETTEIFISRLEQVRKEKGLTRTKLASKVGVTKSAMSCYIRRKRIPRGDILVSIARALDVSIDYLVGISNVKKRQTNADRIRNMSDEEMAERIAGGSNFNCADYCDSFSDGCAFRCNMKERELELTLKWLQSEAE